MILSNDFLKELFEFRNGLHQHPELSGHEISTSERIRDFVVNYEPDELIEGIGGCGLAAVYRGVQKGKTVMLRADFDAVPISETGNPVYKSIFDGTSHACGHDGHTALLAGVAGILRHNRPTTGKVVLLFQPAEETGQGAKAVINDPAFKKIEPDFVFALHNLPGFRLNEIVLGESTFAAASKGMTIKLFGRTAHAAHPENGLSPALAMAAIISELSLIHQKKEDFRDFILATVVHSKLGNLSFGTSPGYAEIVVTLRSFNDEDMQKLTRKAMAIVEKAVIRFGIEEQISFSEEFPALINHPEMTKLIRQCALNQGFKINEMSHPFRWSEDFAYFTAKYPGAMFGVGAGVNHPGLHTCNYDFPNKIIPTGIMMLVGILESFISTK